MKTYNIKFPLTDNVVTNTFFELNSVTKNSLSSDLMLLLLTQKGERWYEPRYGTNLLKYIFEQNDSLTTDGIEEEIKNTVNLYIPALTIDKVDFIYPTDNEEDQNQLVVNVRFTYSEDVFSEQSTLSITF